MAESAGRPGETSSDDTTGGAPWRWAFPAVLIALGVLYAWRMSGIAPVPGVSAHLSNFYLTAAAVVLIGGPKCFTEARSRRRALVAASALAAVNLLAEVGLLVVGVADTVNSALGGVNTSDPLDAATGVLGAASVAGLVVASGRQAKR